MTEPYIYSNISDRIKTLAVVNVLQPVTKRTLLKHLPETILPDSLSSILNELVDANLISREKGYYRVTHSGISFNISRKSKKLRDITRMKYLFTTTKQRGGDSLGR